MKTKFNLLILLASVSLLFSCNVTKYIPEGDKLYTGAEVQLKMDTIRNPERIKAFEDNLQGFTIPQPNKKAFGIRWKLLFWNAGGGYDSTQNIVRKWLKKQGQAPVLLSDVNREYNENLLRNRMENLGFFNASVSSDTIIQGKYAKVLYTGIPRKIYRINAVNYAMDSIEQIGKDIYATRNQSLLKVGSNYNLDVIIKERERIDNDLKNKGYYYFNADNMLVEVDSTIGNHKVDMFVTIKPTTTLQSKSPQRIGNIYVYPDYTLSDQGYSNRRPRASQLFDDKLYIIDPHNTIRKKVLANHIFFNRGQLYNRYDHNQTINQLVNLNMFKFVKNNFESNPDSANVLDVYYYLTPMPKKSLRFEILGKTANVYNGSEANVTWTLRNAFKGAETLTANVFGGYETQTGGNVNLNSSYYRYGAELGIIWPRLLSPYKWTPTRRFVPQTFLTLRYEFLNRRSAYVLNSSTVNFGYKWKESDRKQHDLSLVEIIYTQPRNISAAYQAQMDTVPTLKRIIEKQFSIGPNYNFTSTNTVDPSLKNTYYFKGGLNLSGNILGLIQGADHKKGEIKKLFGTAYSQFIKTELDGRYYIGLGTYSKLATRVLVGMSYSYGNSETLPYLKQFYAGGPYGLRAFRARSVGPGTSVPENIGKDNFFADQTGDYKLELNAEYRARLVDFGLGVLNWAAFVDAGNIWTQHPEPNRPGANITKDFITQLAVGGGVGLRFDFDFLILRTDFATPFRIPYYKKGERWVFKDIDIKSAAWRKNNLIFNLAIGYPF